MSIYEEATLSLLVCRFFGDSSGRDSFLLLLGEKYQRHAEVCRKEGSSPISCYLDEEYIGISSSNGDHKELLKSLADMAEAFGGETHNKVGLPSSLYHFMSEGGDNEQFLVDYGCINCVVQGAST